MGTGVRSVPRDLVDCICVVDNGSKDNTAKEAEEAGALVISHPINLGAGAGIRTGLEYGRINNYDLLAVLAGDNQDDPNDLFRAVDKLIDENTLAFVAIHELGHVMTESVGHTKEFWQNFKFLLKDAVKLGIYKPVDYKKNPKSISIDKNYFSIKCKFWGPI